MDQARAIKSTKPYPLRSALTPHCRWARRRPAPLVRGSTPRKATQS